MGRWIEQILTANRKMFFCELDADLQPWNRNGQRIEKLATAYDDANVWVSGDYLLQSPPAPDNWHHRQRWDLRPTPQTLHPAFLNAHLT